MKEYQQLGHMSRIEKEKDSNFRVYLPHQAVIKETSITTKTRVVFDASSQYAKGKTLNDALYKGPTIQADLFALLIQFRGYKYVLCADVEKMYRQILVDKEQRSLQSILWREDPKDELHEFELNTVTYGTKPASFLAVRCLHQLAEVEKVNYPRAAEVLCNNFYMDDLLTGSSTSAEILLLKEELIELLGKGGFKLHKWRSNVETVKENKQFKNENLDITKEKESRLLGVLWNPHKDIFQYEVDIRETDQRVTKRKVLSQTCKLYDPLGLVGPVITSAKILMQKMWSSSLKWDESVPMHIHREWERIRSQLYILNELRIPRLIVSGEGQVQLQLHGFCDASEAAYGACVYIRERNERGEITVTLVCSKSRVAPMKALSLPRLELCGAVLLAKLMNRVLINLKLNVAQRFYWTDSKIVLAWIDSSSRKWHIFVANRVSEIHNDSTPSEWGHVGTRDNPADLISRGATPEQLVNSNIWWNGPQWLKQERDAWPGEDVELLTNIPEERKQIVTVVVTSCDTV
ncbi:hypothetical protein EUZ93_00110, partial [Wolbachia pipientis]|nr:hypothetical protein [Wolbachia pipientis]